MTARAYRDTTWVSPKVVPGPSPIEATGLFAREAIAEGESISILGGSLLTDAEVRALEPPYVSLGVEDGLNIVIDDDSLVRFGNHSCEPNAWMADAVTEVASRAIAAGEEITIDYAMHSAMPEWQMQCRCASTLCRKTITGDDWTLPALQQRYGEHFSPFILRRIAAMRDAARH